MKTLETFIEESKAIHGDKYDYSKSIYLGANSKIEIVCSKHGSFFQTPSNHIHNHGCRKCENEKYSLSKRRSKDSWASECSIIYSNKYDYSKAILSNMKTPVEIVCPKHGSFWQTPDTHLHHGCKKCYTEKQAKSQDTFIADAKKTFPSLDFSKYKYKGSREKSTVFCKKHGEFLAVADSILRGYGCPKCSLELRPLTEEEFIQKASNMYPSNDYSKTKFTSLKGKIEVVCKKHGLFTINASNHLYSGYGCSICSQELYLTNRRQDFFNLVNKKFNNFYSYYKEDYVNSDSSIRIVCPKHGEFTMLARYHRHGTNCPKCNVQSKGEVLIEKILLDKIVDFKKQLRIKDCKDKRPLPFDFAIFKENCLIALIEYDGEQHFSEGAFHSSKESFIILKSHDKIKTEYCLKNNLSLLRISYVDKQKIEEILLKFLRKISYEI